MNDGRTELPGLSRRVLERAARQLRTPELAEDAADLFAERARRDGAGPARRWYRWQALAALARLLMPAGRPPRTDGRMAGLSLDVKLGVRMLARYPGLTLVGGLTLAFAVLVGSTTFRVVEFFIAPSLPVEEGERVVGLRYRDSPEQQIVLPQAEDVRRWRAELATVEQLGGFHTVERNLGDEGGEPVQAARMSAVGFRVARVAPLLGRTLVDADEDPTAPAAAVLSHRLWQSRFGADRTILGTTIRLDGTPVTVVGVMPQGFRFPDSPELWLPLRIDGDPIDVRAPLQVFARLTPGATLEEAQAELRTHFAGARAGAMTEDGSLTAEVLPYLESLRRIRPGFALRAMFFQLNVFAALFLILVAANVALLLFARLVSREREIVVRSVLGASRARIVTQLLVEALLLCLLATAAGLAATPPAIAWIERQVREIGGELPYGLEPGVSLTMGGWAILLTLIAAVVAGVLPALKATGRELRARLHEGSAGSGGLRLGGIWTLIIVTQIAATVVFTGGTWLLARYAARMGSVEAHFPAEQYLGVQLELDREPLPHDGGSADTVFRRRYHEQVRELERRLLAAPGVAGVTLSERLPGKSHAPALVRLARGPGDGHDDRYISAGAVATDFFEVLGAPVLAGRGFAPHDVRAGANTVLVNAAFVKELLGSRNGVGVRIRYLDPRTRQESGPWHEIVGVVQDLVSDSTRSLDLQPRTNARIYHPLSAAAAAPYPLYLIVHVRGDPSAFAPTLYRTAVAVDPSLRLRDLVTLDRADPGLAAGWRLYAEMLSGVTGVALLLSLCGIYAVMAFTVTRRRREIGIRVALGARSARVVADIFRRPLKQFGVGVAIGSLLVGLFAVGVTSGRASVRDAWLLGALAVFMLAVFSLACIAPTRRALRVQPAEALSAEQ